MYEITFISREEKDNIVQKTIEVLHGKIISNDFMGRRKLAYTIEKEDAGFYTSYVFEIDPVNIVKLDKAIRLNNEILRFLIIHKRIIHEKPVKIKEEKENNRDNKIETAEKIEIEKIPEKISDLKEKKIIKKTISKVKPTLKTEPLKTPQKVEKTAPKIEKQPEKVIKKEESDEEERLKALEEKLEEILKD